VATQAGARRTPEAFVDGLHTALFVAAAIALGGAVVSATIVRDGRARQSAEQLSHTAAPEAL
jgi:hypothetical protein